MPSKEAGDGARRGRASGYSFHEVDAIVSMRARPAVTIRVVRSSSRSNVRSELNRQRQTTRKRCQTLRPDPIAYIMAFSRDPPLELGGVRLQTEMLFEYSCVGYTSRIKMMLRTLRLYCLASFAGKLFDCGGPCGVSVCAVRCGVGSTAVTCICRGGQYKIVFKSSQALFSLRGIGFLIRFHDPSVRRDPSSETGTRMPCSPCLSSRLRIPPRCTSNISDPRASIGSFCLKHRTQPHSPMTSERHTTNTTLAQSLGYGSNMIHLSFLCVLK